MVKVLLWSNFYLLIFLGISRRILWKNENSVYRLQIPALVLEIFKFEKCVKYANEMTDDIIHLTQYYIKYINRAILANFQRRPLKLCRFCKLRSHDNSLFSSPHPLVFNMSAIFSLKNVKRGHKLEVTYLYACWIKHTRHHLQIWKCNAEGGQKFL